MTPMARAAFFERLEADFIALAHDLAERGAGLYATYRDYREAAAAREAEAAAEREVTADIGAYLIGRLQDPTTTPEEAAAVRTVMQRREAADDKARKEVTRIEEAARQWPRGYWVLSISGGHAFLQEQREFRARFASLAVRAARGAARVEATRDDDEEWEQEWVRALSPLVKPLCIERLCDASAKRCADLAREAEGPAPVRGDGASVGAGATAIVVVNVATASPTPITPPPPTAASEPAPLPPADTTALPVSSPSSAPGASIGDRIGDRIERLRLDCGWSVEDLAAQVKLKESSVDNHRKHRSQPRGRTLQEYARVFSEKLGRPITVAELRGTDGQI